MFQVLNNHNICASSSFLACTGSRRGLALAVFFLASQAGTAVAACCITAAASLGTRWPGESPGAATAAAFRPPRLVVGGSAVLQVALDLMELLAAAAGVAGAVCHSAQLVVADLTKRWGRVPQPQCPKHLASYQHIQCRILDLTQKRVDRQQKHRHFKESTLLHVVLGGKGL